MKLTARWQNVTLDDNHNLVVVVQLEFLSHFPLLLFLLSPKQRLAVLVRPLTRELRSSSSPSPFRLFCFLHLFIIKTKLKFCASRFINPDKKSLERFRPFTTKLNDSPEKLVVCVCEFAIHRIFVLCDWDPLFRGKIFWVAVRTYYFWEPLFFFSAIPNETFWAGNYFVRRV